MVTEITLPELVTQKLKAFEQIQVEFETSFLFIVNVHGKQRFSSLTVSDVVRYLHALWMTNQRTGLLSVSKSIKIYEGLYCLDLLQRWQQDGDTAQVVDFLYRKLDGVSCVEITRQIHAAKHLHLTAIQVRRLQHGRAILVNRSMNLIVMLDALFSLSEEELATAVNVACALYGHLPEQIEQQRIAVLIHSLAAVAAIIVWIIHVYAAIWVRGSVRAMTQGYVTPGWAWRHHRKWLRSLVATGSPGPRPRG